MYIYICTYICISTYICTFMYDKVGTRRTLRGKAPPPVPPSSLRKLLELSFVGMLCIIESCEIP